jgi:hypothetical protein
MVGLSPAGTLVDGGLVDPDDSEALSELPQEPRTPSAATTTAARIQEEVRGGRTLELLVGSKEERAAPRFEL